MRALTANLATRPFRNNTVIGSIVAAAAAGLLVATIYNLYIFLSYGSSYALLLEDQERNRTKLEALEVEERSLVKKIDARDYATAFHQGSVANELILKRTFSWTELFNKLENLMPQDVMMSAIRPNVTASDIVIRVEGVAKTHLAFLSLQENLLTHESFSEVYPVSIRRLNPSRPELNFILNFNYRQSEPVPVDTVVAEGAVPPSEASPAAMGGGAAEERAALQEEVLRAAAAANMLPVGRDGKPRTLEVIARRMVAPGGVYEPPAQLLSAAAQGDGRRKDGVVESKTGQGPSASTATTQVGAATSNATQDASAGASAAQGAATDTSGRTGSPPDEVMPAASTPPASRSVASPAGAVGAGNAGGAATGGSQMGGRAPVNPDGAAGAPPPSKRPSQTALDRSRRLQRRRPAAGATGAPTGAVRDAATPAPSTPGPAASAPGTDDPAARAASQSDLDLNFINRPVREAYLVLGQAHGVRFVVDAAIDRGATLNVNLNGLSLEDVIATMAETANHRILLLRPGIYHVVAISEGEPLLEPPVEEETLPATEGAP